MLKSCRFLPVILAASLLGAVGCHSTQPKSTSEHKGGDTVTEADSKPGGPTNGQAAKAHAHYAAGVIHDINEENDAALREYYEAALADPGNDSLVLEVSRRFTQNKQPEKALELLTRAA